jgi:hypothetical protein
MQHTLGDLRREMRLSVARGIRPKTKRESQASEGEAYEYAEAAAAAAAAVAATSHIGCLTEDKHGHVRDCLRNDLRGYGWWW